MALMSLDDQELRTMSKRANQRLKRLEDWMELSGVKYNQAYDVAKFMLEGKKRFKERGIDKLTQEQKDEQRYAVTAFLSNPLSEVKAAKQQQNLKREIERDMQEMAKLKKEQKGRAKKKVKTPFTAADLASAENQAILPSLPDEEKPSMSKRKEKQFWKIFDKAKEIFKDKTFDYRTLAKAITWRLARGKGTTRSITSAMLRIVKNENLNRRMLFEEIGSAGL